MAVIIIIRSEIEVNRITNPIKTNNPQIISKDATNSAKNSGFENPIFSNLPAPT